LASPDTLVLCQMKGVKHQRVVIVSNAQQLSILFTKVIIAIIMVNQILTEPVCEYH
jgi:hypothetical protein